MAILCSWCVSSILWVQLEKNDGEQCGVTDLWLLVLASSLYNLSSFAVLIAIRFGCKAPGVNIMLNGFHAVEHIKLKSSGTLQNTTVVLINKRLVVKDF